MSSSKVGNSPLPPISTLALPSSAREPNQLFLAKERRGVVSLTVSGVCGGAARGHSHLSDLVNPLAEMSRAGCCDQKTALPGFPDPFIRSPWDYGMGGQSTEKQKDESSKRLWVVGDCGRCRPGRKDGGWGCNQGKALNVRILFWLRLKSLIFGKYLSCASWMETSGQ
jgi:hypothetical protein